MNYWIHSKISLVIFDGDGTLWYCLDNRDIALSDNGCGPGSSDFTFEPRGERLIQRNDGRLFELFPEVPGALCRLRTAGKNISLASYNYPEPVFRALDAFGIREFFEHTVAAWTPRKDLMIELILASFDNDMRIMARENKTVLHPLERGGVILVDNSERYTEDALRTGIQFFYRQFPESLSDLVEAIVMVDKERTRPKGQTR
jgi:magnesium-dependent phosphatase-1